MKSTIEKLAQKAKGIEILLVEDDEDIAKNIARMLLKFFATVHTKHTLQGALEQFEEIKKNPSNLIIITDIYLGAHSGLEIIKRAKEFNKNQKVIAISGTEDKQIFIEAIEHGVDAFLLKPIDQERLFLRLILACEKIAYDLELEQSLELLRESRAYALQLLEEQDTFLKNAIHEIHTPLSVIITNIDLLRLQGLESDSLDAIEAGSKIIQNSYEDMTFLIKKDRFLEEQRESIDLVAFVKERINYFECIAHVNQLHFSFRVGLLNMPKLLFSELKLARIIDNTLSNAIKYAHRPSEIVVSVGLKDQALYFDVKNFGVVIKNKKRIFERYYRESENRGGYGLGLSIVGEICYDEGVEVSIVSSVANGTSFRYIFKNATLLQRNDSTITSKQ